MKVLIVEDETAFRQVLEGQMAKEGMSPAGVGTGREALELMENDSFDVVVTDLRLPDIDGIEIISKVREMTDDTPVLLMTAYASVKTAVSALKMGAADYLIKPVRVPDLLRRIKQLHEFERLKRENTLLKRLVRQDTRNYWFPDTPESQRIQDLMSKVAGTDLTVMISGESGTGKGVTARLIHAASTRPDGPFVPVNCGAMPEALVESELFGHVKGAFTGADKNQDGLFVAASGGTIFLDEVGELPLTTQVKLLHVLEEKVVRPVGATKGRDINTRIIAATNRNLDQMVEAGQFRKDLYFRLNVVQLRLPALREMRDSLPAAVEFLLSKYTERYKLKDIKIDPGVWDVFNAYDWPGNFRELDNVIERSLLLCSDRLVTISDLPADMLGPEMGPGNGNGAGEPATGNFKERVQAYERQLIIQAIQANGGDRKTAAKGLGIGLSTLYRKLEEG